MLRNTSQYLLFAVALAMFATGRLAAADATASEAPKTKDASRLRVNFDAGWRFYLGDADDAHQPTFRDFTWRDVDLPHDWSVEHAFSQKYASGTAYLPGGIGWYRKTFAAPEEWDGREVTLQFDGVYRNSEVWLNGKKVGGRPYGYIPFQVRLTPHLKIGEENVIAVRVDHQQVADSRWYTGSGIYRHVWLQVNDPVHIEQWGTFVTTPRVTNRRADITVSNTVVNRSQKTTRLKIVTKLIDPNGKALSTQSSEAKLAPGAKETYASWHVVEKPERWSLDSHEVPDGIKRVPRWFAGRLHDHPLRHPHLPIRCRRGILPQ